MIVRSFSDFLEKFRNSLWVYEDLAKRNAFLMERLPEGEIRLAIKVDALRDCDPQIINLLAALEDHSSEFIEIYLYTQLMKSGVKIFRPTALQLAMLEQITLNITFPDYVQPFDTMVVELPKDYIKTKSAILPQAGQVMYNAVLPQEHCPVYLIINHTPEMHTIFCAVVYSSGLSTKMCLTTNTSRIETDMMESRVELLGNRNFYVNSLAMSDQELDVQVSCFRSILNYCLLLDEVGIKKIGRHNPKHFEKLVSRFEKGPNNDKGQLRLEMKTHPTIYTIINQNVQLYSTVDDLSSPDNENKHGILAPHHRRGHYKMQRFGVGNMEKKRIRIKAVFVNSYLFRGKGIDMKAIYH